MFDCRRQGSRLSGTPVTKGHTGQLLREKKNTHHEGYQHLRRRYVPASVHEAAKQYGRYRRHKIIDAIILRPTTAARQLLQTYTIYIYVYIYIRSINNVGRRHAREAEINMVSTMRRGRKRPSQPGSEFPATKTSRQDGLTTKVSPPHEMCCDMGRPCRHGKAPFRTVCECELRANQARHLNVDRSDQKPLCLLPSSLCSLLFRSYK